MRNFFRIIFRKYILTGVLVLLPLFLTFWAVHTLVKWTNRFLVVIPPAYRPENLIGFRIPGLGLIISLALVFLVGTLVANVLGRRLLATGEAILDKVPVLRWFYFSSKQILEAVFVKNEDSFRRAVLLEYPRRGLYSIGFITGEAFGEIDRLVEGHCYNVFVPTTPNPTSGYLIMVPADQVKPMSWSVDQAFRFIISAGVLSPEEVEALPGEPAQPDDGDPSAAPRQEDGA